MPKGSPHTGLVKHADLFAQALALPQRERLKLAAELLARSPAPGILSEDTPEFARELERRLDDFEQGVAGIPAGKALAEIKESLEASRSRRTRSTPRLSRKR